MSKGIEEILNICLDRITVKGDSIEQCLESYPERAEELEPLLRAALSVVEASSVEPRPEFEKVAKYRLLSAVQAKEREKIERRMPLWSWRRGWAVALAVILVLILVGGSTVTASASSLPGDTLYPVKTATEKVQGFFTFGSQGKANFHIKIAQRRLDELKALSEKKRSIPESVLNMMNVETDAAIEILNKDKPARKALVARMVILTSNQNKLLEKVLGEASPQTQGKLQEALRRCERAHQKAVSLKDGDPESKKEWKIPAVTWFGEHGALLESRP